MTGASLGASEGTCPKQGHDQGTVLLNGAGADRAGCAGLTTGVQQQRFYGVQTAGRISARGCRAAAGGAGPAGRGLMRTESSREKERRGNVGI